MTEILNDPVRTRAGGKKLWFAVGSRFVVPFIVGVRNRVSGVAEFPLSEMIAKT
jgi:hypothetical protein